MAKKNIWGKENDVEEDPNDTICSKIVHVNLEDNGKYDFGKDRMAKKNTWD